MTEHAMKEVIALENEIRAALPAASAAVASPADAASNPKLAQAVYDARDILNNGWKGPGLRLDSLRSIAADLKRLS